MKRETTFLLNVVLALVLLGVLMVYSAGTVRMYGDDLIEGIDTFYYLRRHLLHLALGLVGLFVASRFDYHQFRDRRVLGALLGVTAAFLVVVLVLSVEQKGAVRWLRIAGFGFQPSEFAKLALVIWLAVKLSENQEHIAKFWRGYVPPMLVIGVFCLLILAEYDLGTPVIIGTVALMMCLMAGVQWKYVGGTIAPGIVAVLGIATTSDYWWGKIIAYLDPWKDPVRGYQLIQSLSAFARGGVWGKGLGASEQKLEYLPEAHNDFIFAVWGEEMGLVGTIALVLLFVLFLVLA
ncbi:MAG: FtsW/RodA/SpoVE family cell cycle protein, partial [bacterium]|nr:FtsW/RodA/SpoVE family cell cycle protein [bacterium]